MSMTDKIVQIYIDNLKAAYPWARGENGNLAQTRGLDLAKQAAQSACSGKLRLEGDCWTAALREAGFTGFYTMKNLAEYCGSDSL